MKKNQSTLPFSVKAILLLAVSLNACSSNVVPQSSPAQASTAIPVISTSTLPAVIATATPEPTAALTETPDTRQKPEDWQNWPIIPEVTNKAKEIYQLGKQLGVNPNAFSKIGDCQNVKQSFMGIYDLKRYFLTDSQKDWQQTIDNFHGYFDRDAKAFGQGLNVAAALSPLQADQKECQPDESPLACELRIANPSFAFVAFERWWPKVTPPDQYEKYLRIVLETLMAHGTVPILVTKADNVEGNQQLNLIIAKLAYEYDLPLYNWWRAAQPLPHHGMDAERNDGFHISTDAWTERSAYALGTLDHLWKGLKGN